MLFHIAQKHKDTKWDKIMKKISTNIVDIMIIVIIKIDDDNNNNNKNNNE